MFDFMGRDRTPEERRRDQEYADKRNAENLQAVQFLKQLRGVLSDVDGLEVGLVGKDTYSGATLLVQSGDVTYRLALRVDNDE